MMEFMSADSIPRGHSRKRPKNVRVVRHKQVALKDIMPADMGKLWSQPNVDNSSTNNGALIFSCNPSEYKLPDYVTREIDNLQTNSIANAFLNPSDFFKQQIRDLEVQLQECQEKLLCGICYDKERTRVLNCGHTFCNDKCSSSLLGNACPYCKGTVTSVKPLYLK